MNFHLVDGIREDVTDIVLNVKGISVRMDAEGPKRVSIKSEGPKVVTAADISETADIEILNKDHVICHLDEGAQLNMELTIENGKGYVPAESRRTDESPIGLVYVDALFSPVKRVSYNVEPTREGQKLDYDKLTLQIETNGTVTPEDCLAFAARILRISC